MQEQAKRYYHGCFDNFIDWSLYGGFGLGLWMGIFIGVCICMFLFLAATNTQR